MKMKTFVLLIALTCVASAALATDDLAAVLPKDTVLVVRVRGLHALWKQFVASEAFKRIEQAPIPDIANGIAKAKRDLTEFQAQTGIEVEKGLASIFGTDIALAVFTDRTAAFVARSADSGRLTSSVETIMQIERDEGKYLGEKTTYHEGVEIRSIRVKEPQAPPEAAKTRHHAIAGDLLIVSEEFEAVKRVVNVVKSKQPALSTAEEYRKAEALFAKDAFVTFYADTDRLATVKDFEAFFNGKLKNPVVKLFATRAKDLAITHYVAGSMVARPTGMTIGYTVVFDEAAAKARFGGLMPPTGAPLDVVSFLPPSAVLTYANQVNKAALWRHLIDTIGQGMPAVAEKIKATAGQVSNSVGNPDFEKDLLGQFGDQAALVVLPGPGEDDPPAAAIVLEMKPDATLPISLKTFVGMAATIAQAEAKKKGIEPPVGLVRADHQGVQLTTLLLKEKKLKGKLNPTLFVKGKFLVISTTPGAARALLDAHASGAVRFQPVAGQTTTGQGKLNARALKALLKKHRAFLVANGVKDGKTREKTEAEMAGLDFVLSFINTIDFRATLAPGRLERTVEVRY